MLFEYNAGNRSKSCLCIVSRTIERILLTGAARGVGTDRSVKNE